MLNTFPCLDRRAFFRKSLERLLWFMQGLRDKFVSKNVDSISAKCVSFSSNKKFTRLGKKKDMKTFLMKCSLVSCKNTSMKS